MNPPSSGRQLRLAFHGSVVLLLGLAAGIGLSYASATSDVSSNLYQNWKFAHLEGLLNGLLVLAIAGVWRLVDDDTRSVRIGMWLLTIGAYCNAIGPWLIALVVGHRVIEPHGAMEYLVVYGFYLPGVLPLFAVPTFILAVRRRFKTTIEKRDSAESSSSPGTSGVGS